MQENPGTPLTGDFDGDGDYGSHRPLLWLMIRTVPHKLFLEFGCGNESTPILAKHYHHSGKTFISVETNEEWAEKFPGVIVIPDYMVDIFMIKETILFIDSWPGEQRKEIIEKYANLVNCIIVHDSQPSAEFAYGLTPILAKFRYRVDLKPETAPHTTAVSNFINLPAIGI